MHKLLEPEIEKEYKENFDKFPPRSSRRSARLPRSERPSSGKMYYKAKPQLDHSEDAAAKSLKGDAARSWAELKDGLAQFDTIQPPPEPIAQAMIDNGRESPRTHVLAVGVYDAYKEEVEPGPFNLDPAPRRSLRP